MYYLLSQQIAITYLNTINQLFFVIGVLCVYCEVGNGFIRVYETLMNLELPGRYCPSLDENSKFLNLHGFRSQITVMSWTSYHKIT